MAEGLSNYDPIAFGNAAIDQARQIAFKTPHNPIPFFALTTAEYYLNSPDFGPLSNEFREFIADLGIIARAHNTINGELDLTLLNPDGVTHYQIARSRFDRMFRGDSQAKPITPTEIAKQRLK